MGSCDMAGVRGLMLEGDVDGLIDALTDVSRPYPERSYAAIALGRLHARRAVCPLAAALHDVCLREAGTQALALLGDPFAVGPLTELIASCSDQLVRDEARRALQMLPVDDASTEVD